MDEEDFCEFTPICTNQAEGVLYTPDGAADLRVCRRCKNVAFDTYNKNSDLVHSADEFNAW